MTYTIANEEYTKSLFDRLASVRHIEDDMKDFLNPSFEKYRNEPSELSDIDKAADRIIQAMKNEEKIMIFGDYDVDGIMSSFVLYTFFRKYLGYHQISIQLPHRKNDGYGIKDYHVKKIKEMGCGLIITVDNGITAVQEAKVAKEIGIDMIITDHHHAPDELPDVFALINPQVSEKSRFKEVCGATVAWKLALHLAKKMKLSQANYEAYLNEMLPFVAIATVADCMPLVKENRLIVKKWLELMNHQRGSLNKSLQWFLSFLNIQKVDTYHIGFMIAPRLNATGRVWSAHDGLACLLTQDLAKQKKLLIQVDELNDQRKETQQKMIDKADALTDSSKMIITAADESFHAGIVGIVAGRLTEKYYKPSVILEINKEKWIATGSLRAPEYFSVIMMLNDAEDLLERYGWHEQAWGLTVDIKNLDAMFVKFEKYCKKTIWDETPPKILKVDTWLTEQEMNPGLIDELELFGPYGIGNEKPNFLITWVHISKVDLIGKKERKHLKLHCEKWTNHFHAMRRGKWDEANTVPLNTPLDLIWSIKADDWNGWWYVDAIAIENWIL